MFKLFLLSSFFLKIGLITAIFIDDGNIELANESKIILKNVRIAENWNLCNNVNVNISSMDTDLVELMRRIIISIEGGSNKWNSESLKSNLGNEEAGHGRVSIIF